MSLIKLFLGGNNLVFSRPERVWSVTSRLGTGKWLTLFYSVETKWPRPKEFRKYREQMAWPKEIIQYREQMAWPKEIRQYREQMAWPKEIRQYREQMAWPKENIQ
jgi:hypothetical protein